MKNTKTVTDELNLVEPACVESLPEVNQEGFQIRVLLKKLRGGFLLILGFLLSPLSFWNDLFFNLPIAYSFGYACSWINPDVFLPCSILGYWLSNIVGILMMQAGVVDVFQEQPKERNLKKELLMGLVTSAVYTVIIVALIQFNILETPNLSPGA
jgi:hypothetical protein